MNLILDPSELEKEIENYNLKLNKFNNTIEQFNLHYDKQINNLKNKIVNLILDSLDSKNYILSSNSINITSLINDQLSEIKIEIDFEKYE